MKKISYYDNKNVIYKQLKLSRVQCGLSQKELAAQLQTFNVNLDQQMISKIENNARIVTDYELACFCKVLKTDLNQMLYDFYHNIIEK